MVAPCHDERRNFDQHRHQSSHLSASVTMEKMTDVTPRDASGAIVDELDHARALEYALLATLLSRSPDTHMLAGLTQLRGDPSPLGMAHAALAEAAGRTDEAAAGREYFELFTGLGQGTLLPYASHYLTGTLYGRPLAGLRETLQSLGIERTAVRSEPEDHVAILCEIMAGLIRAEIPAPVDADRQFFATHLASWIRSFFVDLEHVKSAAFYARVGSLGRVFIDIETEAFSLSDATRRD
jgi:TorA maturation chaperone TorD